MNAATRALAAPLARPAGRLAGWITAWRDIRREQVIGALLLGFVAIAPTVLQMAVGPFGIRWQTLIRLASNAELWALTLLFTVVIADQRSDSGTNKIAAYGTAVIVAAIVGMLLGLANSHFVWDALRNPDGVMKARAEINPWVVYTQYLYAVLENTLIGALATYVYVDRREAARMAVRLHEAGLRRTAQARAMLESELQAMQARVEPEFLFNTLAQVERLYEQDPALGERMLDELIAYLRAAMPKMRDTSSTVGQEIDLARAYLAIVKVRLGDRLRYAIDVAEHIGDARMPPMMLLPLIDHAIVHGLEPSRASSSISISARVDGDRLTLTVGDSDSEFAPERSGDDGIKSIRERLETLYGKEGSLELENVDQCGTRAIMKIPRERIDRGERA